VTLSSDSVAQDQLRAFVERIERIEEEIKALNDDKREIYAEAKGNGFDTKALKIVIKERRQDHNERMELEAVLDLYRSALGMYVTPFEEEDDEPGAPAPARAREIIEEFGAETGEITESSPADAPVATDADGPSGDEARQQFKPLPLDPAAQEVGVYTDAANSSSGRTESSADGQTPVQGAEEMTASSLAKDAPDPEQGVQISRPGPLYHEAAAATETAADYLREPAAVVSGQIIREGDAPRETGRHEGDDDHRTGEDASCPDAESRANVDDETAPVNDSESAAESASRPDAGRSASATSEEMDATGRRDGQSHSPDHIADLGKMVTADQSEAQPVEQSGQRWVDDGGHVDDRPLPVDVAAPHKVAPIRDTVLSLRPHCQNPDTCASAGGKSHCFQCRKAAWLNSVEAA